MLKTLKKIIYLPHPLSISLRKRLIGALFKPMPYQIRLNYDAVPRPWFGYCMLNAAKLANALGYPKISIIEFGVAGGLASSILNIMLKKLKK